MSSVQVPVAGSPLPGTPTCQGAASPACPGGLQSRGEDPDELADGPAPALHRYLTLAPSLLIARYERALEITRRPALREMYVRTGTSAFREPLVAMLRRAGSAEPERHTLSLVAWCDGMLFSSTAGSYVEEVPGREQPRAGLRELLQGMLGAAAAPSRS